MVDEGEILKRKESGNEYFKTGFYTKAIEEYSKGIDLLLKSFKDNTQLVGENLHVFYSNRSAAKLKGGGDNEGALLDAEECVRLKPLWGKGYGRKGHALYALERYEEGLESFEEGLAIERTNRNLLEGKTKCSDMIAKGLGKKKEEIAEKTPAVDPMDMFFQTIEKIETKASSSSSNVTDTEKKKSEYILDHEKETKGWDGLNQVERILCKAYKFVNANPFAVFGITNEDATEEDIKKRFRKLSTLLHPDKNTDPRASDAFQQVKDAHQKLKTKSVRESLAKVIKQCKQRVLETRKRLLDKGLSEEQLISKDGTEKNSIAREIKREFAIRERNRLKAVENQKNYEKREQESKESELEYWKNVKEYETKFREGREDRAKSWQGFAKQTNNKMKRKVENSEASKRKEEELKRKKVVGLDETYKSGWR